MHIVNIGITPKYKQERLKFVTDRYAIIASPNEEKNGKIDHLTATKISVKKMLPELVLIVFLNVEFADLIVYNVKC